MKTIWKFNLSKNPKGQIWMPKGARVLCAWTQDSDIYLWAEVDVSPEIDEELRYFYIFGTGWELPEYLDDYK